MPLLLTEGGRAQTWSLFVEPDGQPGAVNMAIDAWLLEQADRTGGAVLRLYRFVPPCLSLGRNEPARERYDREAISRLRLDVVRRPTGGQWVTTTEKQIAWHLHCGTTYVSIGNVQIGVPRTGSRGAKRVWRSPAGRDVCY